MKFTDKTVTQSKPELPEGKTDHIFFDDLDRGFGLRVRYTGSKIWVYQYSRNNKTRRMTIGVFPTMSPAQARARVRELSAERRLGADPARDLAAKQIDRETFKDVVALYLAAKREDIQKGDYRERTYAETERYLTKVARDLNNRPLVAITQPEIAGLLDGIKSNSASNRLRASLEALFNWAAARGKVTANPVSLTEKRSEQSRERVLANDELVAIWNALPEGDFGSIVKLLMLTGQRRSEIGGLRWSEIDLRQGQINLPGERTKNGHPHFVPLSEPVRDILDKQPRLRDHVFGRGDSAEGFAGWSAAKAALDERLPDMPHWSLHDLRRTMATGMGELGVQPHIIEAAINHQSGHKAGVAGTYNRANYHAERKVALDKWATHIMGLVTKPKAKAGPKAGTKPVRMAA
jgi:integrase